VAPEAEATPADTVTVEKWVYGGEGLARAGGRVVLVPFVLPGEKVRLSAVQGTRGGVHAEAAEVIEAAPERVEPPCPIFARCGGCHYQHAPYEFQLARKADILREQLRRVGKIDYQGEMGIVSGPPLGYRNRIQVHIANGKLGYRAAHSHKVVPLTGDCPVASPRLNQALGAMRERLKDPRFPRFVHSIELFTNETDLQVNATEADRPVGKRFFEWCESAATLDYRTSLGTFRVSPRSFFQVNRFLAEKLVETALEDSGGETALDLYAGVGLFAIPMTRRFGTVTAVEGGASAARDLEFNAQSNAGLTAEEGDGTQEASGPGAALHAEHARVEDYLAKLDRAPEFVLADPPRAGLGKTVVAHLARLAPRSITIVSCDPATLARDLAGLTEYSIERVTLVDLFPQTFHIETVVHLRRR
jgi:23S rRNA (uracil1939-C5)-methyltransferase